RSGAGQARARQPPGRDADLPPRQEPGSHGPVLEPGDLPVDSGLRVLRRGHERGRALHRAPPEAHGAARKGDARGPEEAARREPRGLAPGGGQRGPQPAEGLTRVPRHGWAGLAVVAAAEVLLLRRQALVAEWFTPIVWTGYVLLVDGLCARLTGASLLTTERGELVGVVVASVACWWLFEWYNAPRFWRGGADQV